MFQKNAMGKFLMSVPTQMTGSCPTGAPPKIMLKMTVAIRDMDGHMTSTVQPCRIRRQKNGLSFSGSHTLPASFAPSRLPHSSDTRMTISPMNSASASALPTMP